VPYLTWLLASSDKTLSDAALSTLCVLNERHVETSFLLICHDGIPTLVDMIYHNNSVKAKSLYLTCRSNIPTSLSLLRLRDTRMYVVFERENLIMWLKYHHCHMKNHSNTQRSNTGTWRIFWHVHACLWCYHLVMAIRRRWRRWYVTVFVRSKSVGEKIIFLLSHHENITHLKHSNTPMLYNTGTPVGIMSSIVTSLFSMLKCDEKPRIKAAVRALHTTFRCVFYGTWFSSDL